GVGRGSRRGAGVRRRDGDVTLQSSRLLLRSGHDGGSGVAAGGGYYARGNQQPKHTSSESTRPPFSEFSVFHAAPGVSPASVVAAAPAKTYPPRVRFHRCS